MAPKHIRVLLPRNTQADHDVEEVGGSVLASVYNNKNFTALPVNQPMLQAALTDFTASIAATLQGGSQATNEKKKKKHELVNPSCESSDSTLRPTRTRIRRS